MPLKTLALSWQLPFVQASTSRPREGSVAPEQLKAQLNAFEKTTLAQVMETAVRSIHQRDEGIEGALQHVQRVLKTPSAQELTVALDTLALLTRSAGALEPALEFLEGLAVVGLHTRAPFSQPLTFLLERLAGSVHGDDLAFVLEVAREVQGAKPLIDGVALGKKQELLPLLRGTESRREAAQRGDLDALRRLQTLGNEVPRERIHDAHLWSTWLGETELGSAGMESHARLFPAYAWPHGPRDARQAQLDRMTGEDLFVRGRR